MREIMELIQEEIKKSKEKQGKKDGREKERLIPQNVSLRIS